MIEVANLSKFKRRAKFIASQDHLDRAMFQFPPEHHEEIAVQIQPLLKSNLIARKVNALPELKLKDPGNPTLHEDTVQRLNNHAAKLADLQGQVDALKIEREQLQAAVTERDSHIQNLSALLENNLTT